MPNFNICIYVSVRYWSQHTPQRVLTVNVPFRKSAVFSGAVCVSSISLYSSFDMAPCATKTFRNASCACDNSFVLRVVLDAVVALTSAVHADVYLPASIRPPLVIHWCLALPWPRSLSPFCLNLLKASAGHMSWAIDALYTLATHLGVLCIHT